MVSDAAVDPSEDALTDAWAGSWGQPSRFLASQLSELRNGIMGLAAELPFYDRSSEFSSLVGSSQLREHPIHRWYYYKEGFSPLLPPLIAKELGGGNSGVVADPFAGVGTTVLSLQQSSVINQVIGVEYSPFACFVAQTKIAAKELDRDELINHIYRLKCGDQLPRDVAVPSLAAFHNPEIFAPQTLRDLLSIRDLVREDSKLSENEKSFFLLGIAAVTEDLSSAMKDGRALRILRGRKRRRQGLKPSVGALEGNEVHAVVTNQWLAMIEDLERPKPPSGTVALEVRGDARNLKAVTNEEYEPIIRDASVGLYFYSPPYLNFLDYTEVYKLELWLLEMVSDQAGFRALREGTLRSHPSITFPERQNPDSCHAPVFAVIEEVTKFLIGQLARPSVGRIHGYYFMDMYEALREQYRTLEPGGAIACVVANSILSRRTTQDGQRKELWRIPIMTDVMLARLAEAAGFTELQIWGARNLQAKNVHGGHARESIVVAKKPMS